MRNALVALVIALLLAGSATSHPVPNDNHDRTIVVRLTGDAVDVDYRLEVAETRAALDLPGSETAEVQSRRQFHDAALRFYRSVLPENLDASLDGKPIDFTCVDSHFEITDHLRCDFRLRAAWHPEPGKTHTFTLREGNYHDDDVSALRLGIAAAGRVSFLTATAPDEALIAKSWSERKPGDAERLRKVAATFVVADEEPRAVRKPALPPDPELPRSEPGSAAVSLRRSAPSEAVAWSKGNGEPAEADDDDDAPSDSLLHLLLDTRRGFAMLLLLAAALGAAHALTPGHGKTLAAAYLVGERGTIWHALFLGLVTTITHTAAVLVLACLLPVFFPNTAKAGVQTALELLGGFLVAGLGLWLLLVRLVGHADHVHFGSGHGHGHSHGMPIAAPGWRGLVILGISGGIVPCWDAMALLAGTVSTQRLWMGPPLLLAFSAGLASVLVAVGVLVVQARKWAGERWGGWDKFRKIERALPLVSAVVVTAMGLWLCYASLHPGGK